MFKSLNQNVVNTICLERLTGQKQLKHKSGSKDTFKATALDDTSMIIVGKITQIFSDRNNFIGEEAHEVMTSESLRLGVSTELGLLFSVAAVLKETQVCSCSLPSVMNNKQF